MLIRIEVSFCKKFLERAKKEGILPHAEIKEKLDEYGEIQKLEIDQKSCKILLETDKKEEEVLQTLEESIAEMNSQKDEIRISISKYEPLHEIQQEIEALSIAKLFRRKKL